MGRLQRERDGLGFVLGPEQVVGRSSSCLLRLSDEAVSSVHAQISWNGRGWQLRDLGSRNGTMVDGNALSSGENYAFSDGSTVAFGTASELWQLVESGPPMARLVPLDGGPPIMLIDNIAVLPDQEHPLASVYLCGDTWVLEQDGCTRSLQCDELLLLEGRALRFEAPAALTGTRELPASFLAIGLEFKVSSDEEHVELTLLCPGSRRTLPQRSCYYLALTLARQRLDDTEAGVSDPGWVHVDRLLRMIPEYQTAVHLNVDVHRLRKQLSSEQVLDPGSIIERRPGQLRIGVSHLRIVRT